MEDNLIVFFLVAFVFGLIIGISITSVYDYTDEIGQMVCDENGLGDYRAYNGATNTIKCEPKPEKTEYGRGRVVKTSEGMDT